MAFARSSSEAKARSSAPSKMSPGKSDACAAGLPGSISRSTRPKRVPSRHGTRTGWMLTPSQPSLAPAAENWHTALLGTASARRPATMVLIPITRPCASASGPPELPGARRTLACTQLCEPRLRRGPTAWITPVVNAPTKPIGLPIAMASSPGRTWEESAGRAAGRSSPLMCRSARSRRGSRLMTSAGSSRPSQSCTRRAELRATCALVTIMPSLVQITPEPLPREPAWIRTVERRRCSAISPNPEMTILFAFVFAFAHDDVQVLSCTAAHDFGGECFADVFAIQMRLHVLEIRDGFPFERNQDVANQDSCFVCGALRLYFEDDGGCFLRALKGLAQRLRQTHGLQPDTEIAPGDAALLQNDVDDPVHRRGRNSDGAEPCEARRGDAKNLAVRINGSATDGGGLQRKVEPNVGRESRSGPRLALGRNETDDAEGCDRTAGTRPADNESENARPYVSGVSGFDSRGGCLTALQHREVGRGIASCERGGNDAAIGKGHLNFFVAPECMLGGNNHSRLPDDTRG